MTLEEITNIFIIIGTIIGAIVIIYSIKQYLLFKKYEEIKFWNQLKDSFRNHSEIHLILRKNESVEQKHLYHLNLYLGQFELLQPYLESNFLNRETFKSHFIYHLEIITKNQFVRNYINSNKGYWKILNQLCKDFKSESNEIIEFY